jgi:hypothetical protein
MFYNTAFLKPDLSRGFPETDRRGASAPASEKSTIQTVKDYKATPLVFLLKTSYYKEHRATPL